MSDALLGHITMDPLAFSGDRVVQWLARPFLPEGFEDFALPVTVGEMTMVLSVRGMVLPVHFPEAGVLTVSGHTGRFHSMYVLRYQDGLCTLKGNHDGETVDYTVRLGAAMAVEGDTGRNRASYGIDVSDTEVHVHGNVSGARSDYRATLRSDGMVIKGIDRGEAVHYEVSAGAEGWRWKGLTAYGPVALTATPSDGGGLLLNGTMYTRSARLTLEAVEGTLRVQGHNCWGPVDLTITLAETRYRVQGRADRSRVDYQVSTMGETVASGFDSPVTKASEVLDPFKQPTGRIQVRDMFQAPKTVKMDTSMIKAQLRQIEAEEAAAQAPPVEDKG